MTVTKLVSFLCVCFMFVSLTVVAQAETKTKADDWHTYTSEVHQYKIDFPSKPTEQSQTIPSEIGPLNLAIIMYDASFSGEDNLIYMVNYTQYPVGTIHSDMEEMHDQIFRGAVDGAVANVGGKLISEAPIEINSFPGRKVKVDFQDGANVITMKCFLVNDAMYIMQTICETSKDDNERMDQFFDSFVLGISNE